jgi:hypothetical protein
MSRRWLLFVALVGILVAAAAPLWFARPKPVEVTVDVTGTPELTVKGTCTLDGREEELSGSVPTKFTFKGSQVTFTLTTPESEGEFRVRASIDGRPYGFSGSLTPPKNDVRGWVKSGWAWSEHDHWIENFPKDKDKDWFQPPPWLKKRIKDESEEESSILIHPSSLPSERFQFLAMLGRLR